MPEPVAENDDEVVITVKAAAIKQIDKSRAKGTHYSSETNTGTAKVVGGDGVGLLPDGRRVYALDISGMAAQKAVVDKSRMVSLPPQLDDTIAAALPNAVMGSAMALRFRASMQQGDTVLINGATGFTGKVAVQLAKFYGAKQVIATGRNKETLQSLLQSGADKIISTQQDDDNFMAELKTLHAATPIDVVIDYLWGHTAELILASLKGKGNFTHNTRFVSVGSVTGDKIQLSAQILRSVNLQLSGSGLGSWTKEQVKQLFTDILPNAFQLAVDGKLKVETVKINLADIEKMWDMPTEDGKRLVVMI
jgi:NADPH:quinone reductase-like Zn-dependent oxidoreductase